MATIFSGHPHDAEARVRDARVYAHDDHHWLLILRPGPDAFPAACTSATKAPSSVAMADAPLEIRELRLADELDIHAAYAEAVEEGDSSPTRRR